MNMSMRFPAELGEHIPLNAFDRAHRAPVRNPGRYLGGVVVLVGHIALIAAIVWGGSKVYRAVTPEPISVAIIADAPSKAELPPPPPPPPMEAPKLAVAVAPEITIATPPPATAITVQQVKNPAPAAAPSPVAGTGRAAYLGQIVAHLDAAKRYPRQARKLHMEGVVQLHFVMDRAGRVLTFDIAKSSGRPLLDEEVRHLIVRAQPLPPIPADWPQQTLNLVVPVEFELH
jgi:protein TonB